MGPNEIDLKKHRQRPTKKNQKNFSSKISFELELFPTPQRTHVYIIMLLRRRVLNTQFKARPVIGQMFTANCRARSTRHDAYTQQLLHHMVGENSSLKTKDQIERSKYRAKKKI